MKLIVTKSTLFFFFFIRSESHLNAVQTNSLKNGKEACFVDLEWVSRKPNDYLTVAHSRRASVSPLTPFKSLMNRSCDSHLGINKNSSVCIRRSQFID